MWACSRLAKLMRTARRPSLNLQFANRSGPFLYLATAVRITDGRIACAGGHHGVPLASAEVWGSPASGAPNTAWTWTKLPAISVGRYGICGCMLSDGRFAVHGGGSTGRYTSSCEALMVDEDEHWYSLTPMHFAQCDFCMRSGGHRHHSCGRVWYPIS
jgi:hypothetical protein